MLCNPGAKMAKILRLLEENRVLGLLVQVGFQQLQALSVALPSTLAIKGRVCALNAIALCDTETGIRHCLLMWDLRLSF